VLPGSKLLPGKNLSQRYDKKSFYLTGLKNKKAFMTDFLPLP